jgi:hypothetical protein
VHYVQERAPERMILATARIAPCAGTNRESVRHARPIVVVTAKGWRRSPPMAFLPILPESPPTARSRHDGARLGYVSHRPVRAGAGRYHRLTKPLFCMTPSSPRWRRRQCGRCGERLPERPLRILYAACVTALEVFRAADNPMEEQLVIDLERW